MSLPPQPAFDLPETSLQVETVRSARELAEHETAWRRLIECAAEPNPFYEPALLLAALEHLDAGRVRIALFYARPRQHPEGPRVLCGLFPLSERVAGAGWSMWRHLYCFLGTPLVRREIAAETLGAFLDWSASEQPARPFLFPRLAGDGPLFRALLDELRKRDRRTWVQDQHHRALFVRAASAADFRARAISNKIRKELDRKRRRLGETGELVSQALAPGEDCGPWVEAFLELETRGWKGRGQTALAAREAHARFLHQAARAAHADGRFTMLRLGFEGRPIAINTAFRSERGGCYFKIAHDEGFAKHSPGALLELDFLEHLHARDDVDWLDSCADPGHPMIERFWDERRFVMSLWTCAGTRRSSAALQALSVGYAARRAVKSRR